MTAVILETTWYPTVLYSTYIRHQLGKHIYGTLGPGLQKSGIFVTFLVCLFVCRQNLKIIYSYGKTVSVSYGKIVCVSYCKTAS